MVPINNSDTAWLIISDYNQDNGKFYEELREDVLNPEINDWSYEYFFKNKFVGGSNGNECVGGRLNAGVVGRVMGISGRNVVGGLGNSYLVGGNL